MATTERPRNAGQIFAEALAKGLATYQVSRQQKKDEEADLARQQMVMQQQEQERQMKVAEHKAKLQEIDSQIRYNTILSATKSEDRMRLEYKLQAENAAALQKLKNEAPKVDTSVQPFDIWRQQAGPDAPLEDWFKIANKTTTKPLTPAEARVRAGEMQQRALSGVLGDASAASGIDIRSLSELGAATQKQPDEIVKPEVKRKFWFDKPAQILTGAPGLPELIPFFEKARGIAGANYLDTLAAQGVDMESQQAPQAGTQPMSREEAVARLRAKGWTDEEIRAGKRKR